MTEALASRIAGLKLGGIVAVLLLPMLVLSVLMVQSLRDDMAFARREMLGIELSRILMPVLIGAAERKVDDEELARLRGQGGRIAKELGVGAEFNTALATVVSTNGDARYAVGPLVALQRRISVSSNIILDPYAEPNFLGSVLSQHAPNVVASYVDLWTLEARALRDGKLDGADSTRIIRAIGSWVEVQQNLEVGMKAAAEYASRGKDYAKALETVGEMRGHPERILTLFAKLSPDELAASLPKAMEFGSDADHIIGDVKSVWVESLDGFTALVQARLARMQFKLFAFLAIAGFSCIIGVGGAALLFRSTLRQLDEVKLSQQRAEAAHADAEAAAEETRRINDEVIRLNDDLARNLAMLREAQDESLKRGKLAQLGQLTATVAHELRNPLGAVRTSVFLLARKVKDKGLGIEPQIERINNGVTRCDNIISQLLDFARSKSIQPESHDFDDWLMKQVEEEAQKLPASVAIECRLGAGNAPVSFDPSRMSRAIINLLNNASEAMVGKGDDATKQAARNPTITLISQRTARGIEVTVADNGPGISLEHMEKIFEPLFTTKSFGTGLGLPAAHKIMEQHGGGLEVASSPGQGARFTLWWPDPQGAVKAA